MIHPDLKALLAKLPSKDTNHLASGSRIIAGSLF
jgi:hypothetical protein